MIKVVRQMMPAPFSRLALLLVLGAIGMGAISCTSSEDPNDGTTDDTGVASILVTNDYGESLDIHMDGTFQFTLAHEEAEDIDGVTLEKHTLQARLTGTDQVVDEEEIDVTSETAYSWTIDDPADINIINSSGIDLMIYINDVYYFNLADEENRWVMNVAYMDYVIKAYRVSDESQYASTTITVDDNQDYTWTIY